MAMVEHGSRLAQWITGARTGGEPSGAHWDHRAEARDTAGARGGIQILGMVSALTAVVDEAAFSSAEKQVLVALVQSRQASDDDDSELSAPAAAVYVSHSSDFVGVLNGCWTRPNLYWT